jgi:3-phenylpropionate/trans-cinnamate dioxygenase ferredoxin reductase subunit
VGVHAFEGDPEVDTVVLSDGVRMPVDVVIVGIGIVPNTELADAANLEVSDGIVVDAHTKTADAAVYAIGDCSNAENTFLKRRVRLESVPNASEQARVCAAAISGKPMAYGAVPWFWSDQYNLKLQMVGLSQGYDEIVIRGDLSKESFCVFYLLDGIVIAVDAVNRPAEFMMSKKLIAASIRATAAQLGDENTPLKSLYPAASP